MRRRAPWRRGVEQQPEHAGEERQRRRLRTHRPAPRAGEDGEQTDEERRARRAPPAARAAPQRERERGDDEQDVEHHDRAHARERVGAVERRAARATAGRSRSRPSPSTVSVSVSGSPWSTTSRPAISISQVSPTTSAGPKTVSSRIPTRETSRIGNGLDSSTPRSPPCAGRRRVRPAARVSASRRERCLLRWSTSAGGTPAPVARRGRSPQTGPGCTLPRRA